MTEEERVNEYRQTVNRILELFHHPAYDAYRIVIDIPGNAPTIFVNAPGETPNG